MVRYFLLITLFIATKAFTQLGMLDWRIHFSSFRAVGIAESETDVYMACSNGIIEYDTEDKAVSMLTSTNGLSDLGISAIAGDGSSVAIGYANGNLDILEGNTITNIPWIKLAELSGNKKVNSFYFDENTIYVTTNIGLVVVDNKEKEILDTYYPYDNPSINDVTIFQDSLYLATPKGIYYAHKDQSFLNDKTQWKKLNSIPSYLTNANISEVETFGNRLLFAYNSDNFKEDSLYFIENGITTPFSGNPYEILDVTTDENQLFLCQYGIVKVYDQDLNEELAIFNVGENFPVVRGCLFKEGEYFLADSRNGLVKGTNSWTSQSVFSNTPFVDGSYRIDIQYGTVLVAGGGMTHNLQNNFFRNGVYRFKDEEWTNFNYQNQDSLDYDTFWDFISVVVNPDNTDEIAFGSSSEGGLVVIKDGINISKIYDDTNSPLERNLGKILISDMKYDNDGNLWIVNAGDEPLKMLTPDGIWHTFSLGSAAKHQYPYRLLIDNNGTKWVGINHVGLIAFNENGTYGDVSDDQLQSLSASEGYGNLPSIFVKALAQDIDGEIWIGTDQGMVVLYNTSQLFEGDFGEYDANPILIEVDGEVEKLLGTSDITCITVDGGNRKWIGTSSSGAFCLSPDGTEEVYRFTQENSPLISNNVFDIRIDHLSGEVYFATENGIVSMRADATIGDQEFSDINVFPNPVRPDYAGPITIQGLGYQSDVKITDVSGNVVYKTTSNGGTVIWDGNTLEGERAHSGVYLVWSAIASGKGKNVAKILLIN
ncbi:MAG: two-component regulator propeller domain-containing protein [Crocinitomicaceae bacterium]